LPQEPDGRCEQRMFGHVFGRFQPTKGIIAVLGLLTLPGQQKGTFESTPFAAGPV
jgi:hypothetical protein